MEDGISSYHVFMFPFQFDIWSGSREWSQMDWKTRTGLEQIENCLSKSWQREPFETDRPERYNEHVYFHDFAHEALFDKPDYKSGILRSYRYDLPEDALYRIHIKDHKSYRLHIEKIMLNMYSSGVGVLSYHLEYQPNGNNYGDFNDILMINDFGRRIFPQFLDIHKKPLTGATKGAFLPDMLELVFGKEDPITEDFSFFDEPHNIERHPSRLSNTVMKVLGKCFTTESGPLSPGSIKITPVLDDRMFVMCWANHPRAIKSLGKSGLMDGQYKYLDPKKNEEWYKYLFVDGKSITCKSHSMRKTLLSRHTYDRWLEEGTLYGISRNSFMVLSNSEFVLPMVKGVYYRMVNLSLVQRASLLRFSDETARIAALREPQRLFKRVQDLQEAYLTFVNKIYFREISSQEQGIELYTLVQQFMNIERDVKDLNSEIDHLHQYVTMEQDRHKNRLLNLLSIIGALFVIPAFITGFFGMNVFSEAMGATREYMVVMVSILLLAGLGTFFVLRGDKYKSKPFSGLGKLLLILIMLVMTALLSMPLWLGLLPGGPY